jgi:disulfide bond formation protein DsbB
MREQFMFQLILDKRLQWGLFVLALTISLASLYFEFIVGLLPCPLCIMQRLAAFLLTIFLLLKLLVTKDVIRKVMAGLSMFSAFLGTFFAVRQVYLQSLPENEVPACGPSLDMLIQYFPMQDILRALFYGTGDCAKVDWTFLGGSMAFWSMLAFVFFSVCLILEALARRKQQA